MMWEEIQLQLQPITTWYKIGTWYTSYAGYYQWFLVSDDAVNPRTKRNGHVKLWDGKRYAYDHIHTFTSELWKETTPQPPKPVLPDSE